MIRINLLPGSRKASKAKTTVSADAGSPVVWYAAYAMIFLASVGVIAFIYFGISDEIEQTKVSNADLVAKIAAEEKKSARLDQYEAEIAASKRLEQVVNELTAARLGPTRVMVELSKLLSDGGGPTIDLEELERIKQKNPLAGYNKSWDTRRVWLSSFTETDRECRLAGTGRTHDDVAEFQRRMSLSDVFEEVTLQSTAAKEDDGIAFVSFNLTAKVKY